MDQDRLAAFCPRYQRAVELVGMRWTGAILRALLCGKRRFSEIRDCIPDLSDRMLSERLKQLEAEGIIERIVLPETPVRIEYHATEKGRALEAAVATLAEWADKWVSLPESVPQEP